MAIRPRLEVDSRHSVVEGRPGLIPVTLTGDREVRLEGVNVFLAMPEYREPPLAFTPGELSTGLSGYYLPRLEPGQDVRLGFGVRRTTGEIGKTYRAEVHLRWEKPVHSQERAGFARVPVEITFEARPEVYAVLGAAEMLRKTFEGFYEDAVNEGRRVHRNKVLPSLDPGEPAERLLSSEQFQWALDMVQLGSRLFERWKDKKNP